MLFPLDLHNVFKQQEMCTITGKVEHTHTAVSVLDIFQTGV